MNVYWVAAVWLGMALLASLVSIRIGVSVALVEIVIAAVVGNLPGSDSIIITPTSPPSWPASVRWC